MTETKIVLSCSIFHPRLDLYIQQNHSWSPMDGLPFIRSDDRYRPCPIKDIIWSNQSMWAAQGRLSQTAFHLFIKIPRKGTGVHIRRSNSANVCTTHLMYMGIYSLPQPNRYSRWPALYLLSYFVSYLTQPRYQHQCEEAWCECRWTWRHYIAIIFNLRHFEF